MVSPLSPPVELIGEVADVPLLPLVLEFTEVVMARS
jgi:hypothetical protein